MLFGALHVRYIPEIPFTEAQNMKLHETDEADEMSETDET